MGSGSGPLAITTRSTKNIRVNFGLDRVTDRFRLCDDLLIQASPRGEGMRRTGMD
jgi:hypothetical protein